MADYNVTSSDGTFTVNVQTGTINNSLDIPFIGQDAINYGDDLVAAQLRQLENFSNTSEPAFGTARVKGQLWYDSTPGTGRLNVFDGSSFDKIPLDIDVVHTSGNESIADVKTFTSAPLFSAAGAPISVNSNTVVPNLNADLLDDLHATAFATASQGLLADAAQPALPLNTAGDGFVLSADLTNPNNYTWISTAVSAGQIAMDVITTLDTTTNILLVGDATNAALQDPLFAAALTYNAATGSMIVPSITSTFTGALIGNADTATTTTTATNATNISINSNDGDSGDTTTFPVLVTTNSATNQIPHIDGAQLSYDATLGRLNSTEFAGDGSLITALNLSAGSHTGTLAVVRGGTGVTTSTGSGASFVLSTSPVFTTRIDVPIIRKNSGDGVVELQHVTTARFRTANPTATDQASGAIVHDGEGNFQPVGFNVVQQSVHSSGGTTVVTQARVGKALQATNSSGTRIVRADNVGTIPIGTEWILKNLTTSSGACTITSGGGVTLVWMDGSGSPQSDVGGASPFTLARGGIATLHKISDLNYQLWGIGIT